MYRLVLELPYKVTLIRRDRFETEEAAQEAAKQLPGGFQVRKEDEIDLKTALLVPVKEKTDEIPLK